MNFVRNDRCWSSAAVFLSVYAVLTSCNGGSDGALARWPGETVTREDLDHMMVELGPVGRRIPADQPAITWLEDQIRRLALRRILRAEAESQEQSTEGRTQELRQRLALLQQALIEQLRQGVEIAEDTIEDRLAQIEERSRPEEVFDFQHIYFRLDTGDASAKRQLALRVAEKARTPGVDFPTLAREHSDSSAAASGGLVSNVRLRDLDPTTGAVLESLDENEVSDLIESRTGLHLFRLVRRLVPGERSREQYRELAVAALRRELTATAQEALLVQLRTSYPQDPELTPWSIGSFELDAEQVRLLTGEPSSAAQRSAVLDQIRLAEEAYQRGLETEELQQALRRQSHLQALERVFQEKREDAAPHLPEADLREFFDAQPGLFASPHLRRLRLVFVDQGPDSYKTQQRLEEIVRRLREGSDFAATARQISEHRSAATGGDLGLLNEQQIASYSTELHQVVVGLEAGEISDPIYHTGKVLSPNPNLLRRGFSIVRVEEVREPESRSFEQALEDVRRAYAQQNRTALDRQLQDQILAAAGFELLRVPELSELSL